MTSLLSSMEQQQILTTLTASSPSSPLPSSSSLLSSESPSGFHTLPDELQIKILSFLTVQDLLKITGVCRQWYSLVYEGSLWKNIDMTPFYRIIPADQLLKLGLAAGNFLQVANFRGCIQLSGQMLRVLSDYCGNVESLYLKDCRGLSTPSIACFLQNATSLRILDLSSLESVKNSTLQVIGQNLPYLEELNVSWCRNISGEGVQLLVKHGGKCHSLQKLKLNGCAFLDESTMRSLALHSPNLRQLSLASCGSLTDAALAPLFPCKLTHLNLSNCSRLSDRSLRQLALHNNDNLLTHLELAGCTSLTDAGFTFLAPRLTTLIHLDLEDVLLITGATVKALANHQPHLRQLCLSNCSHIDDDAIQYMVLQGVCRQLHHLELDGCAVSDNCLDVIATHLLKKQEMWEQLLKRRQWEQQRKQKEWHRLSLDSSSSPTSTFLSVSPFSSGSSTLKEWSVSNEINMNSTYMTSVSTLYEQPSDNNENDGELDNDLDNNEDDSIDPPTKMTIEVLDCGNVSEAGIRSALVKAGSLLAIKSFYSWRDDQQQEEDDQEHHDQYQHLDTRMLYSSIGRLRGRGHRHLTAAGQSHSSGCVIL